MNITVTHGWPGDPNAKMESTTISCVHCEGTGTLTPEQKDVLDYEENMWCKCKEHHGVNYYEDGEHPDIHKHHYRCRSCKKVTQIG